MTQVSTSKQLGKEYPEPGEKAIIEGMVKELKDQVDRMYRGKKMLRQVHTKMHGCVKALFTVEADLPEELKVGVFKEPKTYQSWVRMSNASTRPQADGKKDIRGFAIKLMGVPGEKLLPAEEFEKTQDFLLMSSETFFSHNIEEFRATLKSATAKSKLALVFYFLNPKHWGLLRRFLGTMIECDNPLTIPYWSTQPYRYGAPDKAVKYFIKPLDNPSVIENTTAPNYLRYNLAQTLHNNVARFEFFVQFQTNANTMPIEDPTVAWTSPFHKVATITILPQDSNTVERMTFGENLSFNSWHSLPEHQPLGSFNRARKVVYETMQIYRHKWNDIKMFEPSVEENFEDTGYTVTDTSGDVPVPTKGILKRSASVLVDCSKEEAFKFIASAEKLPEWLKKSGPVPGAVSVDLLDGSYDQIGQKRKVIFQGGASAVEQLCSRNPWANYSYKINDFSNFLKKLSNAAYGQCWFDQVDGKTRITWVYSFTYRNFFARIFLSLFLTLAYKKFMQASLNNAQAILNKKH